MLKITDLAREKVLDFIQSEEEQDLALRVGLTAAGEFEFGLVNKGDKTDDDSVIDAEGFEVYVDASSAPRLDGATFEYVDQGPESGFRVVVPGPLS